jgi:hypothetical protein
MLKTILLMIAIAVGGSSMLAADALAQGSPSKSQAAKKSPGKACTDLASNSPAHKACIAEHAKQNKAAAKSKAAKKKAS